ncbi:hypothetical protein J437_LFUL010732 [Ladona fulva]|uniref:Selenide, water dikinase n=1 Tax=Ladona fulva TaxID=123851 RepID=A0A8K0P6F9_LADFU|nr:hypothetical protein J437_LFUL010732 [Ladona fulva]
MRKFIGKIACSNVLSDLYAMGVTDCDNILMILGVSTKMSDKERDIVMPLMMRGFKDAAIEAGTNVTGGQTVINPWCMIGGVATAVCQLDEIIMSDTKTLKWPDNAVVGDVLVLTKPLGTQVAICAHQWLEHPERWSRIKLVVTEEDVKKAYHRAMDSMERSNRVAARLMHKFNAHGATDVTGFGLLGHAMNLAKHQKHEVSFVIHNLPVIAKMTAVAKACGNMFQLLQGHCVETSGKDTFLEITVELLNEKFIIKLKNVMQMSMNVPCKWKWMFTELLKKFVTALSYLIDHKNEQ